MNGARPRAHLARLQKASFDLGALLCKTEEDGWMVGDPVWVRVALPQRVRGSASG